MVVDSFKLPVAELGENGEHVEGPPVAHVQMVGLLVVLAGPPVVARPVHLLLVAGQVTQAQQVLLRGNQRHPTQDQYINDY